jgi:beta-lactamase superfamily II metal-dependent hydrolase
MDVCTFYVGQGELVGIRAGNEGIIVDAHMPDNDHVQADEIKQSLRTYFKAHAVKGLILTGFDSDHAHADGVDWILTQFKPDWVMYPKYYKDTDCATQVFACINKHVQARSNSSRPLVRHSIRLDKLEDRVIPVLAAKFEVEVFSPHVADMDCSNNCSIVAKITGLDSTGFRYLATGDTERERWETIDKFFAAGLDSDVMSASHHGSINGVHAKSLLDISPNTVLISAGVDSQYDHPSPAAVAAYSKVAKHVYATNAGNNPQCLLTKRAGDDFATTVFEHASVAA